MSCSTSACRALLVSECRASTYTHQRAVGRAAGPEMCFSAKMFLRQGCWKEPQGNRDQTEQAANWEEQKYIGEIKENVCIVWNPQAIPDLPPAVW